MKHTIKAKAGTTKKPTTKVIAVRVDEDEYLICNKLAQDDQRTLSQMGRILLQKGLADVVADKNLRRAKA